MWKKEIVSRLGRSDDFHLGTLNGRGEICKNVVSLPESFLWLSLRTTSQCCSESWKVVQLCTSGSVGVSQLMLKIGRDIHQLRWQDELGTGNVKGMQILLYNSKGILSLMSTRGR